MAESEADRAIKILGGAALLEQVAKAAREKKGRPPRRPAKGRVAAKKRALAPGLTPGPASRNVYTHQLEKLFEAPDERSKWIALIRSRLPSVSFEKAAESLGLSVNELSQNLRVATRTLHRRLANGEQLTPEETERSLRVARALAKAQQILGDENGRAWLLEPSRALGGDAPITLFDTADGFTAVMDELGRLEYGVIS